MNRMNNPEPIPEELLSALLDGELNDAEVEQVNRALANDANLRVTFEELKQLRGELRSLPRHSLSVDFAERVTAACRDVEQSPQDGGRAVELAPASLSAAPVADTPRAVGRSSRLRMIMAVGAMAATILIGLFAINAGRPDLSVAMNDADIDPSSAEQKSGTSELAAPADGFAADGFAADEFAADDIAARNVPELDTMALDVPAQRQEFSLAAEESLVEESRNGVALAEAADVPVPGTPVPSTPVLRFDGGVPEAAVAYDAASLPNTIDPTVAANALDAGVDLADGVQQQEPLATRGGEYDVVVRLVATESERLQLASVASLASTSPPNADFNSAVSFRFFESTPRSAEAEVLQDAGVEKPVDAAASEMRVIEGTAAEIATIFASLNLQPVSTGSPNQNQLAALGIVEPPAMRAKRGVARESLARGAASASPSRTANMYAIQPSQSPRPNASVTPSIVANAPASRAQSAVPPTSSADDPKIASATLNQSVPQPQSAMRRYQSEDDVTIATSPASSNAADASRNLSKATQSSAGDATQRSRIAQRRFGVDKESAESEPPGVSGFGGAATADRRYRILLLIQPAE